MVFAEAWWVGTKESNPKETRLPIPDSVLQAGARAAGVRASSYAVRMFLHVHTGSLKRFHCGRNGSSGSGRPRRCGTEPPAHAAALGAPALE